MTSTGTLAAQATAASRSRRRLGIGVIGFGWLGQAHSRSMLRIPTLFEDREFDLQLSCARTPCRAAPTKRCTRSGSSTGRRTGGGSWTTRTSTSW